MLKTSSMLVLLAAMLILAACSAADDVSRVLGSAADDIGRAAGRVGDDAARLGDDAARLGDDAARVARQKKVALILAGNADSLSTLDQQTTPVLTAQQGLRFQAAVEKVICEYMKPGTLKGQKKFEDHVAQVAAEVSVPYQALLEGANAVSVALRKAVSDQEELVIAVGVYCKAKKL